MRYISKEEILAAREKDTALSMSLAKVMLVSMAVYIAAVIAALFIFRVNSLVKLALFILLFAAGALLVRLMPYIALVILNKDRRGTVNSFRISRYAKKYKALYDLQCSEICSDRLMFTFDSALLSERDKFNRFTLLLLKFYAHIKRLEPEKAYDTLKELNEIFDPHLHFRSDFTFAKLNHAMQFGTYDDFQRIMDSDPNIFERISDRYDGLLAYAGLMVHVNRALGNYRDALEQLDVMIEFIRKNIEVPYKGDNVRKLNDKLFSYAHHCLDKADLLLSLGDREGCLEQLTESDRVAGRILCDLPPIYLKDHKDLMNKLYPPSAID